MRVSSDFGSSWLELDTLGFSRTSAFALWATADKQHGTQFRVVVKAFHVYGNILIDVPYTTKRAISSISALEIAIHPFDQSIYLNLSETFSAIDGVPVFTAAVLEAFDPSRDYDSGKPALRFPEKYIAWNG